ncbi:MAG: hypothetical protein ACT4O9_16155 [Blastocatellia bacterium]
MVRKILALLAGLVTFFVLVSIVQVISAGIYGMPSAEAMSNPELMSAFIASMPASAFILLAFAYILGSFGSGFVMQKIARWDSLVLPLIVGLLGTSAWAYNAFTYVHPTWMTVLGFFCFIPFALIGYRLGK